MIDSNIIRRQCIVKPNEDDRHREDRIRVEPNLFFALADGAGGQGVFAAEWAHYLLDNLPHTPIKTAQEFTIWHTGIKGDFYSKKLKQIKDELPDLQGKFEREGALSTLLVMWYVEEEKKTYMLSCGDSALFLKTKKFWSSITYPEFMNNPNLVSCIDSYPENKVVVRSDYYYKTGTYILCSDTLAQYIQASFLFTHPTLENNEHLKLVEDDYVRLSQYTTDLRKAGISALNFEQDILTKLRTTLGSEEQFKTYLYQLHGQKLLDYDDYSLIMIN